MDVFIDLLLNGTITDDEIGDFVSVSASWRREPGWSDVSRFEGDKLRFSAVGNFAEQSGARLGSRNGGNWAAIHGEFVTS